jgi:hypothetical protein
MFVRGKQAVGSRVICSILVASILSIGMQFGLAGPAAAKPVGYYQRPCVIKALNGSGLKGNGCDMYGTPRWVAGKSKNSKVDKYMLACLHGGKWAVIGLPFAKAGPQALVASAFLGCATGVADKIMRV